MTNRLLLIILSVVLSAAAIANPIDADKAVSLASQYAAAGNTPRLVHTARRAPSASPNLNTPPLYIFSRGENAGFVIVAGDDCVQPILGVTYSGNYLAENMPPALNFLIESWSEAITRAQAQGTNSPRGSAKAYGTKDVKPLITAHWDQGEPYNNRTPYPGTGVRHSVTGCVATQGAMLAYFWRNECYDCVQYDTPLYTCNGDKTIVDEEVQIKAGTPYHWDLMQDNYAAYYNEDGDYQYVPYSDASADAVSVLMATLGMTSQLNYTETQTSGYMGNLSKAMLSQLGLDSKFTYQNSTSNDNWAALILSNLNAGVPIGYGGNDAQGAGHAFVCDGYRVSDNLFHFNFGFSGMGDGYFALANGNNDDAGGWGRSQHILYDVAPLHPNLTAAMVTESLTADDKNTIAVNVTNDSRLAYNGICLMLSPDVVDIASTQTTRIQNTKTSVAAGTTDVVEFTFTPKGDKPYNYVITDRCGGVLASGVLPVEGGTPSTDFQPYVVTNLDQLEDGILYTLCLNTLDESRGYLTITSTSLANSETKLAAKNYFMVLKTTRGYYLYSQMYNKFVSPKGKSLNVNPQGFFHLRKATSDNRWLLVNPLNDQCLQYSSENVVSYATLTTQDAGNQWLIEANSQANEAKLATAREAIAAYEATLDDGIPTTAVELSSTLLDMCEGETATLTATVKPSAATESDVTWKSSDEQVASVENGTVKAHQTGLAIITVTCGTLESKCQVVVNDVYDRNAPTTLNDIDERVLYTIGTNGYGYISLNGAQMGQCTRNASENGQFVIVHGSKGYYLWSPTTNRFVPANGETSSLYPNGAFDIEASDIEGRWLFKNHDKPSVWMQSWYGFFRNYTEDGGNVPGQSNRWLLHPEGLASRATIAEARSRMEAYENGTVHSIMFRNSGIVLSPGDVVALDLQVQPSTAKGANVTYATSDKMVVSINGTQMTAVALGDAVITATCGDLSAECHVSVKPPFEPYTVTSLDQITEGDVYTFDLGNRGYLTYDEPTMGDGLYGKAYDEQKFALLKGNKGYYIWNIAAGKFVPAKDNYVLDIPNGAFTLSAANTKGKWIVKSTVNGNWMQHGGASQFLINDSWKTQDDGNQWTIEAVERIPEHVYAAAKQTIADYELTLGNVLTSLNSIKEGVAYLLFTPNGSLLMESMELYGSCVVPGFKRDPSDASQQWGILKMEDAYYLYNVGADYLLCTTTTGDGDEASSPIRFNLVKQGNAFMIEQEHKGCYRISTEYLRGMEAMQWIIPDDTDLFTICKTTGTYDAEKVKELIANGITVPTRESNPTAIYDLQGRRVTIARNGLYIVNGKKIAVK